MIDRDHAMPLVAQAWQFGISRSSVYYLLRTVLDAKLVVMRRIDELHLGCVTRGLEIRSGRDR